MEAEPENGWKLNLFSFSPLLSLSPSIIPLDKSSKKKKIVVAWVRKMDMTDSKNGYD